MLKQDSVLERLMPALDLALGLRMIRKRGVAAAGHYAAIVCEPAVVHFQGSSSSILVFG